MALEVRAVGLCVSGGTLSESNLCDLIWWPPTTEKGRIDKGQTKPQTAEIKDHADQRQVERECLGLAPESLDTPPGPCISGRL